MKRTSFRTLLKEPGPLITPTAHDALSARMIERAGFRATGLSGSATLAALFALPDVGLAGLGEMVEGVRAVARGTTLPFGADADDGFGDARNVVLTVRTFEQLGCGQLVIEDQIRANKRPGDGGSQTLITTAEMCGKLRAALDTRDDYETMIVARTDAAMFEGLDGALRRADAYLETGADAIFVAGLSTPEELRRIGEALHGANLVAVVGERRIRTWPAPAELYDLGYNQINYPGLLINRVYGAMNNGLELINRVIAGKVAIGDVPDHVSDLAGLSEALDLSMWSELGERYGAGA